MLLTDTLCDAPHKCGLRLSMLHINLYQYWTVVEMKSKRCSARRPCLSYVDNGQTILLRIHILIFDIQKRILNVYFFNWLMDDLHPLFYSYFLLIICGLYLAQSIIMTYFIVYFVYNNNFTLTTDNTLLLLFV